MNRFDILIIKILLCICKILSRYGLRTYSHEIQKIDDNFEVVKDEWIW